MFGLPAPPMTVHVGNLHLHSAPPLKTFFIHGSPDLHPLGPRLMKTEETAVLVFHGALVHREMTGRSSQHFTETLSGSKNVTDTHLPRILGHLQSADVFPSVGTPRGQPLTWGDGAAEGRVASITVRFKA